MVGNPIHGGEPKNIMARQAFKDKQSARAGREQAEGTAFFFLKAGQSMMYLGLPW